MEGYKIKIGRYGENLAAKFLQKQGLAIIERNYHTRYGEIDLIARNGDEILFVEVKTRTNSSCGYPEEAVDHRKVSHLVKAINIYMVQKRLQKFWRLDAVSVELDVVKKTAKISWFKNVTQ